MLDKIDLTVELAKAEYKRRRTVLIPRLQELQRKAFEHGIPVMIVLEGWEASGKGTLINELTVPLDPRGFKVHSILPPNEEELLRPYLWRFWIKTPARGRIKIFDRSWYRPMLFDRAEDGMSSRDIQILFQDVRNFERQLTDDGTVIIKLFLHISRKEQKRRFKKLLGNPTTAWRIGKADLRQQRDHKKYVKAVDAMLAESDTDVAPWTVVEAEDHRHAAIKVMETVAAALEAAIRIRMEADRTARVADKAVDRKRRPDRGETARVLTKVDLNRTLTEVVYDERVEKLQTRLRELEYEIYRRRMPVIVAYEGWDAAGKGGNIRRLVETLDPRGYEVVPVSAPNDLEKVHHHLWRFWTQLPKAGHLTLFDRTWYGRVLVERVEGFCTEPAWRRAYREINEMEQHWVRAGVVLCKFWLHISRPEQLARFKAREAAPEKQWKITPEDWRNRTKWNAYEAAVNEMLVRTSTPDCPWTIVEANCKRYARVKTLETLVKAIEAGLKRSIP